MKKIKYILLLVLLLSFGNIYSQRSEKILNELSELLRDNDISPELFYNHEDKILDIDGYQINLYFSRARYEESDGAMLGFICDPCTRAMQTYDPKTGKYYDDIGFKMKDKKSVYRAIDLVNELKDMY